MKHAAFPKCFLDELVRDRTMTLFQWIDMAADLPVDGLELYDGTLTSFDDAYLRGLCSPDHPIIRIREVFQLRYEALMSI